MAFYCYSHAAMEANLSKSTFKVYHVLAQHVNNKSRSCFLRKKVIAKIIGKSESTVNRAFTELEKKGLMKRKYQYNKKGEQIASLYTLLDTPEIPVSADARALSMPKSKMDKHTLPTGIIEQNMDGTALKVYCYIKNHSNKGGKSFLCIDSIAKDLSVCWRTVHRAIKTLVKIGMIRFKASLGKFSTFLLKKQEEMPAIEIRSSTCGSSAAKDSASTTQNHKIARSKIMRSLNRIFSMRI